MKDTRFYGVTLRGTTVERDHVSTTGVSPATAAPSREAPHAVVVGAGLGGLSTAVHLLLSGWRVTVFEKNERAGGRMNVIEEQGFRMDMGPTLLMMPEVLRNLFAAAGRDWREYLDLRRLDPAYTVRFGDGSAMSMRASLGDLQSEVAQITPRDAERIPALFAAMERQYRNARYNFIEQPFNGIGSLLRPRTLKGLAAALPMTSVYRFVARHIEDERVRQALTFQTLYLGISPHDCPSIYGMLPYVELEYGVWFPMGGMGEIAKSLVRLVRELGGDVQYGTAVQEIQVQGRRAAGVSVRHNGAAFAESVRADVVVANVDTPTAYQRLVPAHLRRKYNDSKLARMEYGCSAHLLYLGVRDLQTSFGHHEVLLSSDFDGSLEAITRTRELPRDPAMYVCIPTRTDASLAPEGHDVVYILTPVPHLGAKVDWSVEGPRLRETVLATLERRGMPGLRERIVLEREFTPADFEARYGCFNGSAFGLSPLFLQSAYFRPHARSEDVDGLYFAGAGTHPGGGVPIVLTSGRLAAETINAERRSLVGA